MRKADRIDSFCVELAEMWKKVPDWRFMQLINNFQRFLGQDGFYIEDDELLEKLREYFSHCQ